MLNDLEKLNKKYEEIQSLKKKNVKDSKQMESEIRARFESQKKDGVPMSSKFGCNFIIWIIALFVFIGISSKTNESLGNIFALLFTVFTMFFIFLGVRGLYRYLKNKSNISDKQNSKDKSDDFEKGLYKMSPKDRDIIEQVSNMISNRDDYNKLSIKIEELEEECHNTDNPIEKSKLEKEIEALEKSLELSYEKVTEWQFIPDLDLFTPIKVAKKSYSIFKTAIQKEDFNKENPGYEDCFYSIAPDEFYEDLEDKPVNFDKYIDLLSKINKTSDIREKMKFIDEEYSSFTEESGIYIQNSLEYAEDLLRESGVPKANIMVREGFYSVAECKNLSIEKFSSFKGVGKVSLEEFKDFINPK